MSLPLPLRLTLFYALLLALALSGFGFLVYHQAEQRAYHDLDALLCNRAASVALGKDMLINSSAPNSSLPTLLSGINELGTDGVAIEVLDQHLTLLASTNIGSDSPVTTTVLGFHSSPVPWDRQAANWILARPYLDSNEQTPNHLYSTILYEGRQVRVYTTVNATFGPPHIIQTASSEQPLQQSLSELRQTLLLGGLLVLLLALGGGLFLTWGALAAVRRVTRTAREISASRDFRRRVPLKRGPTQDEIATLAETFNTMLASLENAYQQQKRFIADASHELRAPITSVRCNLDLLTRAPDLPADEVEAALTDARTEADRMGRLVSDLLTLARADEITPKESGPQAAEQENKEGMEQPRVDLDSLLLEVFRQYRGAGTERDEGGGPRLTLQHITPARVSGDADQLKQVIVALLDNALKYTPPDGSITLSLSADHQEATLKVSDTGIGIAPEDLPHIFERFYRADRARSREQGGSGLGLAIVESIAQEHRGHIDVQSIPGKGSTFSIHLPCIGKPLRSFPDPHA